MSDRLYCQVLLTYFSKKGLTMKFADKLREIRESKDISRQEMADSLKVSLYTVINWEQGSRIPTFPTVQGICKALSVRCTVFDGCDFGDAEDKPGRGRPKKGGA
jgi:transcriptional regulator with XRE-family HTH domain